MSKQEFKPQYCKCCGQTTNYKITINRGIADTIKAIAVAIKRKGINCIHPRKEMEINTGQIDYKTMVSDGKLTSNQVGNLSRCRFHGFIARVDKHKGNYCLTRKGIEFLRGEPIPQYAVVSKSEKRLLGYYMENKFYCRIEDFKPEMEYWDGINFHIEEGKVIKNTSEFIKAHQPQLIA